MVRKAQSPDYTLAPLPTEEDVILNWWLAPATVKKALGIKVSIPPMSDFFVLKEFPFGVLAYDYEEGLKIKTSFAKLPDTITWLREFHIQNNLPLKETDGFALVNAHSMVSSRELSIVNRPKFEAAGLVPDKYDSWKLVA